MVADIAENYSVGALLYAPALHNGIARLIEVGRVRPPFSIALCLEDAISDDAVAAAETQLIGTFAEISRIAAMKEHYIPRLFVRVRSADQLLSVYDRLHDYRALLCGFIIPKYATDNAQRYHDAVRAVNIGSEKPVYMMPILESRELIGSRRQAVLRELSGMVDSMRDLVLNVRVGGNDFCNYFGLRRPVYCPIYELSVIRSTLEDILTVFSTDYVVSAPVWEYFAGGEDDAWLKGLRRELLLDRLNGFIGKTAIHPTQIPAIVESLQVDPKDYADAVAILDWDEKQLGVGKSAASNRMNEVKCHRNWAEKTRMLASIYGIRSGGETL